MKTQAEYTAAYRARNREKVRERDRLAKAAMPLEVKRAANARWRAGVSEEWRDAKRAYNRERLRRIVEADPDHYAKQRMADLETAHRRDRERYIRHREARIADASRLAKIRRVRIAGNGISKIIDRDWRRMVARYRACCAYCGQSVPKLHQEHVIPVARGGRHSIGNLLPVCPSCNRSKGKRLLVEWRHRQQQGLAA